MSKAGSREKFQGWKLRNAPYLIAACLAFVMVMLVAPEVNEGDSMEPAINDGDVLVVSKTSYSVNRGIPDRDQVVILEKNAATDVSEDNLIARVAGLPGEKVEIKDGSVYIDGDEYVTPGRIKGAQGDLDLTLSEDEVFLLCDNRDEELDSRNKGLGPVDMKDIKGNVLLRIWPLSGFGGIE